MTRAGQIMRTDLRIAADAKRFAQLDYARAAIRAGFDDRALTRVFGLSVSEIERLRGQVRAA